MSSSMSSKPYQRRAPQPARAIVAGAVYRLAILQRICPNLLCRGGPDYYTAVMKHAAVDIAVAAGGFGFMSPFLGHLVALSDPDGRGVLFQWFFGLPRQVLAFTTPLQDGTTMLMSTGVYMLQYLILLTSLVALNALVDWTVSTPDRSGSRWGCARTLQRTGQCRTGSG